MNEQMIRDLQDQIATAETMGAGGAGLLGALTLADAERYRQQHETIQRIAPAVEAMPVAQVRRRALFRVFCSDCDDLLQAAVLDVQGINVLLTRRRSGGFQVSGMLDVDGAPSFCRKRRLTLTTGMVRYALERGRRDVHSDHRARPGEPHYAR
ncbi:hypothetical protein [Brachybacterium paraconglomeratum]|uniref:hypothetical protein n=1 Tax=Brachybacterium paraconglomeratum TaxID=173362 RepID=UPI0021A2DB27|nr:hypothetical protein [Brachybacterium paraconglomeratum]MCT1909672.1 hypothetical protein [Brachybacterium paraconglomeratum]